jgi:hypothetical protein
MHWFFSVKCGFSYFPNDARFELGGEIKIVESPVFCLKYGRIPLT